MYYIITSKESIDNMIIHGDLDGDTVVIDNDGDLDGDTIYIKKAK